MQRSVLIAVLSSVLAAGAASASPPIGWIDGLPHGGNGGTGQLSIIGWAGGFDAPVVRVDVYVDGIGAGRALYGGNRSDVEAIFGFEDSGWTFRLDTTRYLNGLHTISAVATNANGEQATLGGAKVFEFTNLTHDLVPFGEIDFPNPNATLFGNCDAADSARRLSVVTGWALDSGVEEGDQGVGYVELMIDGAVFANSRTDCRFDAAQGGLTDCYGLRRVDVTKLFPDLANASLSGFRFVLDVGVLIDELGLTEGRHVLTIRAGDIAGQVAEVASLPTRFRCDDDLGNQGSFGYIDRPAGRPGAIVGGTIQASGWALDWEGVLTVTVFVDGIELGQASYGIGRPGVARRYPGYPDSANPGWHISLDTTKLENGIHRLSVVVRDVQGFDNLIGERRFDVRNP